MGGADFLMPFEPFIDKASWATVKMRKRTVDRLFNDYIETVKEYKLPQGKYLVGVVGARRKKAILNFMDKAMADFDSIGLIRTEKAFTETEMFNAALPHIFLGLSIQLGAALWILDKLMLSGKIWEANKTVFPYKESAADNIENQLPSNFTHSAYPNETIGAVLHVLYNRYQIKDIGILYTENAARTEPLSETYRKLIALLPEADVKAACDTYRTKVWEVVSRTLKAEAYYQKQTTENRFPKKDPMPSIVGTVDKFQLASNIVIDRHKQDEMSMIAKLNELFCMDKRSVQRETGSKEVANAIGGFRVEDPYELCFALMYLLATDDDTPWLIGSNDTLFVHTVRMLPWYTEDDDELMDEEEDENVISERLISRNNWTSDGPIPDTVDLYHGRHNGKNLSQIIYLIGKGVAPSGIHPYEKDRLRLISEGMNEEAARKITDIAETHFFQRIQTKVYTDLLASFKNDDEDYDDEEDQDDDEEILDEEYTDDPESDDYEAAIEELRAEASMLKKQVKSLKTSLAATRQEANKEKAQYERELRSLRIEHRELADLREIVFRSGLSKEEQEKLEAPEKKYSYPYTTRKRTVVFGGHDSFLRAIKPMLPDVQFVDPRIISFEPEIVRRADVVWIQANSMSHSLFWNVTKHCRLNETQMRYFGYASAEKCAEQLIEWDQKENV